MNIGGKGRNKFLQKKAKKRIRLRIWGRRPPGKSKVAARVAGRGKNKIGQERKVVKKKRNMNLKVWEGCLDG